MKIKLLIGIYILLTGIFLSDGVFAQRKTTAKPTPTPIIRDLKPKETNQTAEKRLALIVGNANYLYGGKLRNPVNDARDMSATLKKLGFTVIDGYDLTLAQMEDKIRQFGNELKSQKGVGLVYYAGHGIQFNGSNYLIPVDANIKSEQETKYKGLNLGLVLDTLEDAKNGFNIVILDACRNNPFARSWNRDAATNGGLAQTTAPTGTFIAYATAPGSVAADGTSRNGTFTAELLKQIQVPNLAVEQVFKNVRQNVTAQTNNRQTPWDSSSLVGDFYFSGQGKTTINNPIIDTQNPVKEENSKTQNRSIPSRESIMTNYTSNLLDDVIKDGKIFLENEPNNGAINSVVGLSLLSKGKISEAISYVEKGIALGEEISLRVFRLKTQALINDDLKPGLLSLTKEKITFKIGNDTFIAKFADLKDIKFIETQSKDYAIFVKGDFLYIEQDGNKQKQKNEKNKELVILSPQAVTQQVTVGTVQRTVAFCKGCELWTKEMVRLINQCRTGEISKGVTSNQSSNGTTVTNDDRSQNSNENYSSSVNLPAENYFTYQNEKFQISIPTNWRNVQSNDIAFAPENAYGKDGITHGLLVMFYQPKSPNKASEEYIQEILTANSYLKKETPSVVYQINGRPFYMTGLTGISPVTKKKETVFLYSVLLKDKRLLTFALVCPFDEMAKYAKTFGDIVNSIRLKD